MSKSSDLTTLGFCLVCFALTGTIITVGTVQAQKQDIAEACATQGWYVLHKVDPVTLTGGSMIFCRFKTSEEVKAMTGESMPTGYIQPTYTPHMLWDEPKLDFTERPPYDEFPDWYQNMPNGMTQNMPVPDVCSTDPDDLLDLQECP